MPTLFKVIETANATSVDIKAGQYIIQDDGQMFYDNIAGSRVTLSPDLAGYLLKTFSNELVKSAVISTEDNTTTVTITSINPSNNSESTKTINFSSDSGSITITGDTSGTTQNISLDVKIAESIESNTNLPVSSAQVKELTDTMNTTIADNAKKATATIKVIDVAADSNDNTALGTWNTVAGAAPKTDDIAILTHTIGETDKSSYTGYVYDGTAWKAMDGNYDASNVYLGEDILLAGGYTSVGNVNKGSNAATKDAGWDGMSIAQILTAIFTQTLNPTKPTPSVSAFTLANTGAKEVGITFTPQFTVTYAPGTYAYGSARDNGKANGATYAAANEADNVTVTDSNGTTFKGSMNSDGSANKSIQISGTPFVVSTSTNYKGTKAEVIYKDGVIPWTNTKQEYAASQVKAGTATRTAATGTVTGYYPCFWGYKTTSNALDVSSFDSATIKALGNKGQNMGASINTTDMKQLIFAAPAGKYSTIETKDANGLPAGTVIKFATQVDVVDASNEPDNTSKYDVWYIDNTKPYTGAMVITITAS